MKFKNTQPTRKKMSSGNNTKGEIHEYDNSKNDSEMADEIDEVGDDQTSDMSPTEPVQSSEQHERLTYYNYNFEPTSSGKIEQEALLAEAVRRYPSLYDKRDPFFKRSNDVTNPAWENVARDFDWIHTGINACRQFEVLKKRYSKKKMSYKKACHFSNSPDYVKKAKLELDRYSFLNWLEPHIRYRSAKMMLTDSYVSFACADNDVDEQHYKCKNNDCCQDNFKRRRHENPNSSEDNLSPRSPAPRKISLMKPTPVSDVLDENGARNVMNGAQSRIVISQYASSSSSAAASSAICKQLTTSKQDVSSTRTDLQDPDEIFLAMVHAQLRALGEREKCLAKHEISSILFKAQLKQLEER